MNIRPRLVLFDLDGTLYVGDTPIPGAIDCLAALRAQGIALRFLTNTTTKSQQQLVGQLRAMGFTLGDNELISAPVAARLALEKMQQHQHTQSAVGQSKSPVVACDYQILL